VDESVSKNHPYKRNREREKRKAKYQLNVAIILGRCRHCRILWRVGADLRSHRWCSSAEIALVDGSIHVEKFEKRGMAEIGVDRTTACAKHLEKGSVSPECLPPPNE
jgi:hypothetical protein